MSKFRKKPVVIDAIRWEGTKCGLTNGAGPFPPTGADPNPEGLRLELPKWMPTVSRDVSGMKWHPGMPAPGEVWRDDEDLWIGTLEGNMVARPGDWIICGVKGELYPCKPDIFAATYEPIA